MVHPSEMRRREERKAQATRMAEAAAVVRERGPDGFAGLDAASAPAMAELIEVIAEDWKSPPTPRVWKSAARVARYVLNPAAPAPPVKPLPDGYRNADLDRLRGEHPVDDDRGLGQGR